MVLGRQAANMNWFVSGRVDDGNGYKDVCYSRDGMEAKVSYISEKVFLLNPYYKEPFIDFLELERWIAIYGDTIADDIVKPSLTPPTSIDPKENFVNNLTYDKYKSSDGFENVFQILEVDMSSDSLEWLETPLEEVHNTKETSASLIREWAEARAKEANQNSERTFEDYTFSSFMYIITRFGREWKNFLEIENPSNVPYSGDLTFFELTCLFFSHSAHWLNIYHPKMKEQICDFFYKEIIKLYSRTLSINNIEELFFERVKNYDKHLVNNDLDTVLCHIIELVRRTEKNNLPQRANFDDFKYSIKKNSKNVLPLILHLVPFLQNKIPLLYESLDKYILAFERHKSKMSESQQMNFKDKIGCLLIAAFFLFAIGLFINNNWGG